MGKAVKFIISLALPLTAGLTGSFFTRSSVTTWYQTLNKPLFNPPDYVFAPVWTLLYLLMGVSFFLIWNIKNNNKKPAVAVYFIQLFFNFLWSAVFFGLRNPLAGLFDIILLQALIAVTILFFHRIHAKASYLLIPYLGWVTFASVLNFSIVLLN